MINIRLIELIETGSQYTKNLPLGLAICSLFIYEIFQILPFSFNNVTTISMLLDLITNFNNLFLFSSNGHVFSSLSSIDLVHTAYNLANFDHNFTNFLQIQAVGQSLYTNSAILLIITSVILLLAMISPIFMSRTN
jgi:NADH-ubiquinone oxidoreductase chain 6